MNYNWKEIFKDKTVSELVSIIRKNSYLNNEAKFYAKQELLHRKIDLTINDEENQILKYEIWKEELVKLNLDIKNEKYNSMYNRIHQLFGVAFSFILILIWIFSQFDFSFINKSNSEIYGFSSIQFLLIFVFGLIFGIYRYFDIGKKNEKRDERISELKKLIQNYENQKNNFL